MSMSEKEPTDEELQELLSQIYNNLLQKQVDLDSEAKRILYDNLWDLYERS